MNKLLPALIAGALIGASVSAIAVDDMKHGMGMQKDMKAMDTNGDGMISKDEFMKYEEGQFDKMKKNKDGMVDMKDMGMMHDGMKSGKMTKDHMTK